MAIAEATGADTFSSEIREQSSIRKRLSTIASPTRVAVAAVAVYFLTLAASARATVTTIFPENEIEMTFVALARARYGWDAENLILPSMDYWKFNIFSWLAAPLIGAGYTEGGRVIAFAAAAGALVFTFLLGRKLWSTSVGLLAAASLAAMPLFAVFAVSAFPGSLSLFLSSLAVWSLLKFRSTRSERYFVLGLLSLVLGILDHNWVIVMALPLATILFVMRSRVRLGLTIIAPFATLGLVQLMAGDRDLGTSLLDDEMSILRSANLLLEPEWWYSNTFAALGFLPSLVIAAVLLVRFFRAPAERIKTVIMLSWFAAGLAFVIYFPQGHFVHPYYTWGLLPPLGLAFGVGAVAGIVYLNRRSGRFPWRTETVVMVVAIAAAALGGLQSVMVRDYLRPLHVPERETLRAEGESVRELAGSLDLQEDQIAVVFEGSRVATINQSVFLLYAGVVPRVLWPGTSADVGSPVLDDEVAGAGHDMIIHLCDRCPETYLAGFEKVPGIEASDAVVFLRTD